MIIIFIIANAMAITTRTKTNSNRKQAFNEFISKKQLKSTKQRDIIFEQFFNDYIGKHVTVEELYEDIKTLHPTIGFATVYRTLKLFRECGIATERNFGDGKARYEPIKFEGEHHHHIICNNCGTIIEFANIQIENCLKQIAKLNNFDVTNHRLEIYGKCEKCRDSSKLS